MKIALIGYGKMGKAIEQIAIKDAHEIVLRISSANAAEMTPENLRKADVAIEFSKPETAQDNVLKCLSAGVPVVCGTTGWNGQISIANEAASENNTAFLHASNFSIGVNIFFEINKSLAALMKQQNGYDVEINETHHTQKKDIPSGTAITLAEQIIRELKRKKKWSLGGGNEESIPVFAHRLDQVPGTHSVTYASCIDDIKIIHIAHNREGFARGALAAAVFLKDKKGVFTMKDVLF